MRMLYDYDTHEPIREATEAEYRDSVADAAGPDGMIIVDVRADGGHRGEDYRRCYVEGTPRPRYRI